MYWAWDSGHEAYWTKHPTPCPPKAFILEGIWMKSNSTSFLGWIGTCRGLNIIHPPPSVTSSTADPNSSTDPGFLEFGMDQRLGTLSYNGTSEVETSYNLPLSFPEGFVQLSIQDKIKKATIKQNRIKTNFIKYISHCRSTVRYLRVTAKYVGLVIQDLRNYYPGWQHTLTLFWVVRLGKL